MQKTTKKKTLQNVAILCSGGDSPGMNCVIRAITRSAIGHGLKVYGIKRGYSGLINNDFIELNASSDALQCTSDALKDTRHFSNTLFNIMRGGIFDDNYSIEKRDFETYFFNANQPLFALHKETLSKLSDPFSA